MSRDEPDVPPSPAGTPAGREPGKSMKERWAGLVVRFQKDKAEDPFDLESHFPEFKGWEAIGFHRSLGQELWQVVVEQINNALYLFILVYLIPIIRPFPEIDGYAGVAAGLFTTFFVLFDICTNFNINRFIAEHRVGNPKRMLMYVSFIIRYQMITGVIQITALTWFSFEIIAHSNYAYTMWMLLIGLQKQWPGMLGIFKTVLSGMQHHAKVEIMNLLQGQIVERITLIGFVLYGRWWGETNPAIGIIMGICIFTQVGNYIDDVIFGIISAHVTNNLLKKYIGVSLGEVFRLKISREVYKEMINLGVQNSILPVIGSALATYNLVLFTSNIAGYVSYSAYLGYGRMFSNVAFQYGDFGLQTAIAESYSNGKKALAEFYVSYSLRWRYFFSMCIGTVMVSIIPYFIYLIENTSALDYYRGSTVFFLPMLLIRMFEPLPAMFGPIMIGANKITEHNLLNAIGMGTGFVQTILFIMVFRIQDGGVLGMFFLLALGIIHPSSIINYIIAAVYIRRKVLKIKIYWRATFLGPFIAALPLLLVTLGFYNVGFLPMLNFIGVEATITIAMAILAVLLIFTYFPLSVFFGFDDYMFSQFRQAVNLSGPSKPVFLAVYKLMKAIKKAAVKLGLWEREGWSIPYEKAHEQVIELMELKRRSLKKFSEEG